MCVTDNEIESRDPSTESIQKKEKERGYNQS